MNQQLYEHYSSSSDLSGFDYIVIGSGIGGLTIAVWLAKSGEKVAILERHYIPGGFTHSFKRKGFEWDVGVHYVGNLGEDAALIHLFNFLSNHNLEWESMGDIYDVIKINGKAYELLAGKENLRKQLKEYFPSDKEAIDKYLKLIEKSNKWGGVFFLEKTFKPLLSKAIGWFIKKRFAQYSSKTTLEVLNSITKNQELINLLSAQCGNYGLSPDRSSFAAHAMVTGHFIEGAYYPKGGVQQISNKIIENLNNLGGKVFVNAEVERIIIERNKVEGILIDNKLVSCKNVISNVGVNNTFTKLLSQKESNYCGFNLKNVEASTGHLCLYIGLDKSNEELNLPRHNIWFYKDGDIKETFITAELKNVADKFSYISFPSAKDPLWGDKYPNKSTIQAISMGRYEWFEKYELLPFSKRGGEYNKLKKDFELMMLERVYSLFPQIKGHVVATEVSTPLSTKHFVNYQNGEIYGLEHTPKRFSLPFLRFETQIKGLRLVGQDLTLVGVAGAMLSGLLCATTILKFKTWKIFKNLKEKT